MNLRLGSLPAVLTSIMLDFILRLLLALQYHLYTAILFTWTDYKTIFLPVVSRSSVRRSLDMHSSEYRPSLRAQQHQYGHSLAFFSAGSGYGPTSFYAMYPIKHAAAKKTKSIIRGALSRLGEYPNLRP
jgi:hypothetical protein